MKNQKKYPRDENGIITQEIDSFKEFCRNKIAVLEEENKVIKQKLGELICENDEITRRLLPERAKHPQKNSIAFDLTSFPLPGEMMEMLDGKPVKIVDVGALELEGHLDLYSELFARYPSEVVGFEPQNSSTVTKQEGTCLKKIFPWAIGDGSKTVFYRTKYPAASSTLRPDGVFLNQFIALPDMLEVDETFEVSTKRLDDIDELRDCDLLKIDVQGGELKVLEGASDLLDTVSIIMTEIEFSPLYENQPVFSSIDDYLRRHGFFLLNLSNPGYVSFKAGMFNDLNSRLMWADAIYVKEPDRLAKEVPEKIMMAVLVAHMVLRDPGLAASLLEVYDDKTASSFLSAYQAQMHLMRRCHR
jgi:FkbM family methyltransferase